MAIDCPQAVDNKGNIQVPYAGAIRAQGRTGAEIQAAIVAALKDRALEPQAVVSLGEQRSSLISVVGDAVGSIRFPANPSGERILDAIARAGLRAPGYDLWVMLERQGRRETIPFGALVYEPANNIYVRPGDTIFIYSEPQAFLAFGATAGFLAGFGWVALGFGIVAIFENRPLSYVLINGGYMTLALTVMGAILGGWL